MVKGGIYISRIIESEKKVKVKITKSKKPVVKWIETRWIEPLNNSNIYKIKYLLGRYKGYMKNGTEVIAHVYEPIVITYKEMYKIKKSDINKKKRLAKLAYTKRVKDNLFGNKRIGLPNYAGRFYFLNPEYIV